MSQYQNSYMNSYGWPVKPPHISTSLPFTAGEDVCRSPVSVLSPGNFTASPTGWSQRQNGTAREPSYIPGLAPMDLTSGQPFNNNQTYRGTTGTYPVAGTLPSSYGPISHHSADNSYSFASHSYYPAQQTTSDAQQPSYPYPAPPSFDSSENPWAASHESPYGGRSPTRIKYANQPDTSYQGHASMATSRTGSHMLSSSHKYRYPYGGSYEMLQVPEGPEPLDSLDVAMQQMTLQEQQQQQWRQRRTQPMRNVDMEAGGYLHSPTRRQASESMQSPTMRKLLHPPRPAEELSWSPSNPWQTTYDREFARTGSVVMDAPPTRRRDPNSITKGVMGELLYAGT